LPATEQTLQPGRDVALAPFTTLGIGGAARWFATAARPEDVEAAHQWADRHRAPLFVLGGGSNVLVADAGFDGLVLRVAMSGLTFASSGADTIVRAGAGELWDRVVEATVARGLGGLECLSGIPGSVGGTPIQNVGAYGQEAGDVIDTVAAWDRESEHMVSLPAAACAFAYRTSRFKHPDAGRFVVCSVTFRLRSVPPTLAYPDVVKHIGERSIQSATVADVRQAVLAIRRAKGMVLDASDPDTRSVGSFFVNPTVPAARHRELVEQCRGEHVPGFSLPSGQVKIPAAWLIERAGFSRGFTDGDVGLSSKHPLAIVNRGGATARDVLRLATRIKRQVADRFGIMLRPEPVFVGFGNDPEVDYLLKDHVDAAD
jgi:UDP-N-acetylmuramate dehydrogenase